MHVHFGICELWVRSWLTLVWPQTALRVCVVHEMSPVRHRPSQNSFCVLKFRHCFTSTPTLYEKSTRSRPVHLPTFVILLQVLQCHCPIDQNKTRVQFPRRVLLWYHHCWTPLANPRFPILICCPTMTTWWVRFEFGLLHFSFDACLIS